MVDCVDNPYSSLAEIARFLGLGSLQVDVRLSIVGLG